MKNLMRNLTMSAAALAALVAIAPKADAQNWNRAQGREPSPSRGGESRGFQRSESGRQDGRQERRENAYRGPGRYAYAPPVRAFYGRGYVSPFRVYAGSRFYSTSPGVGYFFVNDLGWVFPPFPGAVWVPAHYDFDGFFIEGGWQ